MTYDNLNKLNCAKSCGVVLVLFSDLATSSPRLIRVHRAKRQNTVLNWDNDAILFNNADMDDDSQWWRTTPRAVVRASRPTRPQRSRLGMTTASTVAVPGMGTTRTACEDNCLSTQEYNPVCGTNGVTYHNHARLNCASRCTTVVGMQHLGRCSRVG